MEALAENTIITKPVGVVTMTDKELVKMLRICGSGSYKNDCDGCPAKYDGRGKSFVQAADRLEALLTLNEALNERDEASKELAQALKRKNSALERNVQCLKTQVPKWVRVEERLPELNTMVVGMVKDNPYSRYVPTVIYRSESGWVVAYTRWLVTDVTHWMPIPEPRSTEEVE